MPKVRSDKPAGRSTPVPLLWGQVQKGAAERECQSESAARETDSADERCASQGGSPLRRSAGRVRGSLIDGLDGAAMNKAPTIKQVLAFFSFSTLVIYIPEITERILAVLGL